MILRTIGIILLCLLAFLLLLILLVLFAPIKYRAELELESKNLTIKVRITWCAIIRIFAEYLDKKLNYRVKAAFITIMDSNKLKKQVSSRKTAETEINEMFKMEEVQTNAKLQENVINPEMDKPQEISETIENIQNETESNKKEHNNKEQDSSQKAAPGKKKFKLHFVHPAELYGIIVEKVQNFWNNINKRLRNFEKKLDKICEMISSPENREFVVFVIEQLKDILKHVFPQKCNIYIKAGFADPSLTGQVLGACSVINSISNIDLLFEPDFDNEVLEVKSFVQGRIRIIHLVIVAIKVLKNKTFRKFIRRK